MKRKAPEKPKRPVKPAFLAVQDQEIQLDSDRWSGFRDSFGEREVGIDADGSPIELLRLVRECTSVEHAIADRIARLAAADRPGIARALRLEHDDQKRRPRLVLVSERIAGVRLSEAITRGISRSVVPDIGAALYVMRRLFTAAESLHAITGVPHLIIAPERVILTPRAEIVITEAALAGATESLTTFPKALRLSLSNVNGQEEAHRVDIARIARVGISMMLGRLLEPNETVDALSPVLSEIADVASIRADDVFATAFRTWIEQAVTIDAATSFTSFRQAGEALAWTDPPKDCAPSRRTLKTFLNDLALEDLRLPDTAALEADRILAIRARQTEARPERATTSVWDSLAPELGLARQDEVLQESLEEIESAPLNEPAEEPPEPEAAGADEIDMSEAIAEIAVEADSGLSATDEPGIFEISEPIGELSVESFEIASAPAPPVPPSVATVAPPPAGPAKDVVLRAVANRFGFLLREDPGKRKTVLEPSPRGESVAPTPPVTFEPEAAPLAAIAEVWQAPSPVEPAIVVAPPIAPPAPIEWPAEALPDPVFEDAFPSAAPAYEEPPLAEEPIAIAAEHPPWIPPADTSEAAAPKRQKRSWFRSVAKQFGMGEQAEVTEEAATERGGEDAVAEVAASASAQQLADTETERAAAEAVARHVKRETARMAAEAEARWLAEQDARRITEAAQHLAEDEEARRFAAVAAHGAAEAEAQRLAEDDVRRLAEGQARAEARRMVAEEEAQLQATELEARHQAAEAEAHRVAEEETVRLMAEAEERRRAEEDEHRLAAEAEVRRRAEDEAKRQAEAEAHQRAEQEARSRAEEEVRRLAAEAEARRVLAEKEAARRAETEARQRAEQETRRRAEEEARRLAAEVEARRRAEEEAKRRVEAEARQRAEQEARRRAEEEARRLAAEAETRRREAEARQQQDQEARRRAEDQARHIAAEAEVRRLAAIAEAETHRLEAEGTARRAAAEAQRRAADAAARRLAEEEEDRGKDEPVEPASRTTWLNSVAAEMGLKDEKPPDDTQSTWHPAAPAPESFAPPPTNGPQSASAWQTSAASVWQAPSVPTPQTPDAWQPPAPALYTHASESWQPATSHAAEPTAVYEPAPKRAKEPTAPSRLPEVAAAVSQMFRSAALLLVAGGLVGGLAWAGYSFYSRQFVPGTVVIESNPDGAEILIDGAAKGVTPLTIELTPGQHKLELRRRGNSRELTLDIAAGEQLRQQIDLTNLRAIGTLVINSTPKGATVSVDGRERGVTPLTLTDLDVGAHSVLIESSAGSIQKNVQIVAGGKVTLDEAIFSGWIAVFAPFELKIYERKRVIGTTENGRIMLSAGRHELEFVNDQRGFRDSRVVEVGPGAMVAVNIQESETEGIVRIDAPAGTEVFIDGKRVGESPLEDQRVSVGTREILAKHPQLGEKKVSARVTSSQPADVKIEFTSQP